MVRAHLRQAGRAAREVISPLEQLEMKLHPWVGLAIMPLFALANAGVTVGSVDLGAPGASAVALGVAVGLALGKPLGIVGLSYLAVVTGLSKLPRGVDFRGLLVVGLLGGIGFTMALFIGQLAFAEPASLSIAKLAVLVASAAAGIVGLAAGWLALPRHIPEGVAVSVDLAERSTNL